MAWLYPPDAAITTSIPDLTKLGWPGHTHQMQQDGGYGPLPVGWMFHWKGLQL
jgi:hypothetical protein